MSSASTPLPCALAAICLAAGCGDSLLGGSLEDYAPAFDASVSAGVELTMLEHREDWVRARLLDGREAWFDASSVESVNRPRG